MHANKTIKIFCLLLALILFSTPLTGFCIEADKPTESTVSVGIQENVECTLNSGFETHDHTGTPANWEISLANGEKFVSSNEFYSGTKSLYIKTSTSADSAGIQQSMTNLVGGTDYSFTMYMKEISRTGRGLFLSFESRNDVFGDFGSEKYVSLKRTTMENGWIKCTATLELPQRCNHISLEILWIGGEVYFDDISLVGKKAEQKTTEIKNPIINGTFEMADCDNLPYGWTVSMTSGKKTLSSQLFYSGSSSLYLKTSTKTDSAELCQTLTNLVGGTEYRLIVYLKQVSQTGKGMLLSYTYADGSAKKESSIAITRTDTASGWTKCTGTVVLPQNCDSITVKIQWFGGEVYIDDFTLTGEVLLQEYQIPKVPKGEENLLPNPGFESGITGWNTYPYQGATVEPISEKVHSGAVAVKITNTANNNPYIGKYSLPITAHAEYLATTWYNSSELQSGYLAIKYEFYDADSVLVGQEDSKSFPESGDGWKQVTERLKAPPGAVKMSLLFRLYGKGTVYFDDTGLYLREDAGKFQMDTDAVFYYSDATEGTATVGKNSTNADYNNVIVDFYLLHGQEVLFLQKNVSFNECAVFVYPLSLLSQLGDTYTVRAIIKQNGSTESLATSVYKYNRPTYLRKDGVYLRNGEPFYPVIGYHVSTDDYSHLAEGGINVVQCAFTGMTSLDAQLKVAEQNNIMIMPVLYFNMKAAGNTENIRKTKEIVQNYKDNPYIYAWMIMDEPFYSMSHYTAIETLENSYKLIRDIDPNHPTYIVECYAPKYKYSAKYADILAIDPYPGGSESTTNFVSERLSAAKSAAGNKAVYAILQAYDWGTFPRLTEDETRNNVYQAIIGGASGLGFFSVEDSVLNANNTYTALYNTPEWQAYKQLGETDFPVLLQVGVKTIRISEDDSARYKSFTAEGTTYVAVASKHSSATVNTNIPFSDLGIANDSFVVSILSGGNAVAQWRDDGLEVSLSAAQAVLLKIEKASIHITKESKKVTANCTYRNGTEGFKDIMVCIAVYKQVDNKDVFSDFTACRRTVSPKTSVSDLQCSVDLPSDGKYYIKAFAWDIEKGMEPLCEAKAFEY